MRRDIDLARTLLFEIESGGVDCPINRLRTVEAGEVVPPETSERVRYHVRLLIDAGLVKEVDRTHAGVPCVRLTNNGHELAELARSDARWQEAKRYTRDSTGGLSLTVMRAVLTKWAVEGAAVSSRGYRRSYYPYYHRVEPRRRYDLRDRVIDGEDLTLVRSRPDYRERWDWRDRADFWESVDRDAAPADRYEAPVDADDGTVGVSLPIYLV